MEINNKQKGVFDVEGSKSVLNVDAQKELMEHNMKLAMKYMVIMLLVMLPLMALFVLGLFYFIRNMVNI